MCEGAAGEYTEAGNVRCTCCRLKIESAFHSNLLTFVLMKVARGQIKKRLSPTQIRFAKISLYLLRIVENIMSAYMNSRLLCGTHLIYHRLSLQVDVSILFWRSSNRVLHFCRIQQHTRGKHSFELHLHRLPCAKYASIS